MSQRVRKIALTGGIASGKSLAADYLKQRGVPVIDADEIVHDLLKQDEGLKTQIRETFGGDVFDPGGEVNRDQLGRQVFKSSALRKQLESWIHPKVRELIERFFLKNQEHKRAIAVIPLLFEANLENGYDEIWLMETDETRQLARLVEKRGRPLEDSRARIQSQMPMSEKLRRAALHACGRVIRNVGTPEALYRQLDALLDDPQ